MPGTTTGSDTVSATHTRPADGRPASLASRWWRSGPVMLARGVHVPEVLAASVAVVAVFSVLPILTLPVGIISADEPGRMPVYLIEPILLAIIATPTCFSAAATLQATASRRARRWHTLAIAVVVLGTCTALALQPNVAATEVTRVLTVYLGSIGMMLLGAAGLGQLGWVLPLAYLLLLAVIGASGFGELSVWAWSLKPLPFAVPAAGVLLMTGMFAMRERWRRRTAIP